MKPQKKNKNVRNNSLIREKHLMLLIMKYQIEWRQREAFLRDQPKKFFSQKNASPKVPEHFEFFMFSDDKSVAALKGTAENKVYQSIQTQNWLTSGNPVVNLDKTAGLPRETFQPSNLADDAFQKKKPFHRQKIVSSPKLPQKILRKNIGVCGKKCPNEKRPIRFKSFFFPRNALSSWNFLDPPSFQEVFFLREKSDLRWKAISGNSFR